MMTTTRMTTRKTCERKDFLRRYRTDELFRAEAVLNLRPSSIDNLLESLGEECVAFRVVLTLIELTVAETRSELKAGLCRFDDAFGCQAWGTLNAVAANAFSPS